MQGQEIAYKLGMELVIPTKNFDYCVVEALCVSECHAKHMITSAIEESYEITRRNAKEDNSEETEGIVHKFGIQRI